MASHSYYGNDYGLSPSAPAVDSIISARLLGRRASMPVKMLLDSGADYCCLPEQLIRDIERELGSGLPYGRIEIGDYEGRRKWTKTYKLHFEAKPFGGEVQLDFIGLSDSLGILGRPFLNLWPLVLDGPGLQWGVCTTKGCHRVAS